MGEIIFVILLAGGMLGSGAFVWKKTGHWQLLAVFVTFFLCFGLWEWHATSTTGQSISQHLWALGDDSPFSLWAVIGSLLVAWLALMWHFGSKLIGKFFGKK